LQVPQFSAYSRAQPISLAETPQPNVSIQQKFQSRSTSQSSSSFAGEMMSPRIFISFIEPIPVIGRRGRGDLRDGTPATSHPDRLLGLLHLIEDCQTLGFELGDSYF